MSNIIKQIEAERLASVDRVIDFRAGDTIRVSVLVTEGTRQREQNFEGVVIALNRNGAKTTFTVRRVAHGEGVERLFQFYSPTIVGISIIRRGDVRRAKINYIRGLSARKARIKEKISHIGTLELKKNNLVFFINKS